MSRGDAPRLRLVALALLGLELHRAVNGASRRLDEHREDVPNPANQGIHVCRTCFESIEGGSKVSVENVSQLMEDLDDTYLDISLNGTLLMSMKNAPTMENATIYGCESSLTVLKFWGASMVVFANAIYIVPYLIVVFLYFAIPDLRHRAYDIAVLSYNITQIVLNVIIIGLGWSKLCHREISPGVYRASGLTLMYLTLVSTLWLFVICLDMMLAITRLRWTPSGEAKRQDERRKVLVYSALGWGMALLPTAIVCVVELTPWVPRSSPFKPNFDKFDDGPNLAVILYVAGLPALVCATNSVLFLYTTYRMIVMKRSTSMATRSSTKTATKKYYVFLRLYLLMDAPWFTNALGAIFPDLWILKFLRMIQPILMLMAIVPRKTLAAAFRQWFGCVKRPEKDAERRDARLATTPA